MMCDIANVTPAPEVAACTDVLQQAMADISSVDIQPCKEAFTQACMALQVSILLQFPFLVHTAFCNASFHAFDGCLVAVCVPAAPVAMSVQ
jgi:hypothetical protein